MKSPRVPLEHLPWKVVSKYIYISNCLLSTTDQLWIKLTLSEIKQQMEKDVDEVGKIAHKIKNQLQDIDRDVLFFKKTIDADSSVSSVLQASFEKIMITILLVPFSRT